jgi:Mrp family chromosome partitioning ATPase
LPGIDDDRVVRAHKILRTRVRRRMLAQQWRSVGVTGTAEGVGKTVTALNLGITMGRDPASPAVLVDLDLYRPKVAMYLGMEFRKGIAEYLLGEASIEEILYSPGLPGLAVVPNGRPLRDGSELLASARMTELVKYLEALQPAHTVIYDLPPLLLSDDVLVFSPHMDCVLDVVAVGVTPRASLQHSQEILSELNVVGVVLNRATEQDHTHSYYY